MWRSKEATLLLSVSLQNITTIKTDLTRNLRTHTSEKPFHFQCPQSMSMSLKVQSELSSYTPSTGEKPFQCDQCPYRCSMKVNLTQHRLNTQSSLLHCKCTIHDPAAPVSTLFNIIPVIVIPIQIIILTLCLFIHSGHKPGGKALHFTFLYNNHP